MCYFPCGYCLLLFNYQLRALTLSACCGQLGHRLAGVRVSPMGLEHWRGSGGRVGPAGASRDGAVGGCQLRWSMTWKGLGEQLGRKQKGRQREVVLPGA